MDSRGNCRSHWVHDFAPRVICVIGGLEIAGAVGLIAPAGRGSVEGLTIHTIKDAD